MTLDVIIEKTKQENTNTILNESIKQWLNKMQPTTVYEKRIEDMNNQISVVLDYTLKNAHYTY